MFLLIRIRFDIDILSIGLVVGGGGSWIIKLVGCFHSNDLNINVYIIHPSYNKFIISAFCLRIQLGSCVVGALFIFILAIIPYHLYNRMTYRQRNIPVTSKEEIEVQTDIRLLQSYLTDMRQDQQQRDVQHTELKFSRVYSRSGLLRPFSDQTLLKEFSKTLQELKGSQFNESDVGKRLELLEKQIEGLLKRDLLINGVAEGSQTWNSYYFTLNQKEKTIIKLQNQKSHSDLKIQRLRSKIQQLQLEVDQLRTALVQSQKTVEQNKLYSSFYEKVNRVISTGKSKGIELDQLLEEQVVPLTTEFSFNLSSITRTINKDIQQSMRSVVSTLARQFDRLLKQQQFTQQKLNDTVTGLINNFKAIKGVDYLKTQFDLAGKTVEVEESYRNMLSLVKYEIDSLKSDVPNLKGVERLDTLLLRLQGEGVELFDCKGWVNLVKPEIKVIQVNSEDKQLRELIGILAGQFKRVSVKFPQLKSHISAQLIELFESQVLIELIQGASIEKLKQIIIHTVETVKVDNVYQYESTKDHKTIFHLRILIKSLLESIQKVRKQHNIDIVLDQGILGLLKENIVDGVNIQQYIALFRPLSKIIEVPVIVQKPVYETKTFQKGIPIRTQQAIVLSQNKVEVVTINKQIPVYIDRPIDNVINKNIPVSIETQKAVPVEVIKEIAVDRIVESAIEVPVIREKAVALHEREEISVEVPIEKMVEVIHYKEIEKAVQVGGREYIEIQKIVQKPVYMYETKQQIKQVQVRVPQIIRQTEYVQVERSIPYIIEKKQIVNIERQIPIQIRVPQINVVQVVEYRDRPIVTKDYKQIIKQVPVTQDKQLYKQVPKQIFIERSHFIKGDTVEVIKQVEVFVDKPIIHQIMVTKDTEVDKIVPLYITEQVPVIQEVSVPYIKQTVRELEIQKVKLVPVKEEIVKKIHVDKPVPIVVQKEVIRIEKQIEERIVQKIVEVPRVVEIERIVQKIVVVPRIIEKIVQVPKIIERIVIVEQPILQIVQIFVPQIIIQQVEKPVQVIVQKIVIQYEKDIQIVQVQKIVQRIIYKDRIVEVQVQKRIPFQVVREVSVPTYRDRIQYQRNDIRETKVQTIQVQVPLIVAEKVPFYIEKPVVTEHIIEQAIFEKIYTEKEKIVINEVQKLVIREIMVERVVNNDIVRDVPGPETIKYVYEPQIVEVIKEKIVELHDRVEVPKQVFLQNDKIVHQIHEKLIEVPVNQIVVTPQLVQIPKLINLVHYKQIPVEVPVREERVKRDIIQQIKTVQITKQVPVEVQICRQKIKQITNQIKQFITSEVVRDIFSEVQVRSPVEYEQIEVQGKTIIQQINNSSRVVQIQQKLVERVVEKIVMLPQIVQVVRHIHHISQVNSLGVAVDVDVNVQTQHYLGVSKELRKSLVELLTTFRSNVSRQPDLKNLIVIIQKYLKFIDDWIAFPKLIQIPRQKIVQVQKQKIVLVPTSDKQKESVLSFIIQKLLSQLKRIKQSYQMTLALDEDLMRIFFTDKRLLQQGLDKQLVQLMQTLKSKHGNFGEWSQSNPFLVNSFLQDHFAVRTIIDESNKVQEIQLQELNTLRHKFDVTNNKYQNLLCFNRKMFDDNATLIKTLQKYRSSIEEEQYNDSIRQHKEFYNDLTEEKHSFVLSTIRKSAHLADSAVVQYRGDGSQVQEIREGGEPGLGELIGKLSKYQNQNQQLTSKTKSLENEVQKTKEELVIKNSIIQRLENDFDGKLNRAREQLAKNPNLNKDLFEQNKKLQEKSRILQREINAQRANGDKKGKELQRSLQSQKRDFDIKLQRKEKEIKQLSEKNKKQIEREVTKIKQDLEKIKKDKERLQLQLSETKKRSSQQIKIIRQQQLSSASDKYNQLISQNIQLRKKSDIVEQQLEKVKRASTDNTNANQRQFARLKQQNERLAAQKRQLQKNKKAGFLDLPQETQVINKNIELTKKIEVLENQLNQFKSRDQGSYNQLKTLKDKVRKLEIELDTSRKQVQAAQKYKLASTQYQSGFKPTMSAVNPLENVEGSVVRSPRGGLMRSGVEKGYMSPEGSQQSRQQKLQDYASSSSRVSQSSEQGSHPSAYKSQMTLREFMDTKHSDEKQKDMFTTFVMIKVIQKIQEQAQGGMFNSYSPNNIYLNNFNVKNLQALTIKFGAHIINKNNKNDGLYLSPEILAGSLATKKSTVFCLGVILDELIHGSTFFKSIEQIQNPQIEFKVRGDKLNPILKNTLFEMMNKEPNKRLQLLQAKRRLSLQKYISSEGRSSTTTTTRLGRRTEE